jgi:hypothetical protein
MPKNILPEFLKSKGMAPIASLCMLLCLAAAGGAAEAAELTKETTRAWDRYFAWADEKVQRELQDPKIFLIQNALPAGDQASVQRQLESGQIAVRQMYNVSPPGANFKIPGGEIHHWWGAIMLRNTSLARLLEFLQDYDNHGGRFADVEKSRLISKNGNRYRFFFRVRRSKSFVTAYYNTEQECLYTLYGPTRASSQSLATKIAELDNPGTASEREKTPGNDRGFLWRLASWWRFEQRGNNVVIELESASLSCSIPLFVKIIPGLSGYIRSTPRESLESVLNSIRIEMARR